MELDFYTPKNEILKRYIQGYYFISANKAIGNVKYWTFPNNYCILSVNQNFMIKAEANHIMIRSSENENILTSLVTRYTQPIQIHYEELVNELTIYFKPLGMNHFVTNAEDLFLQKTNLNFTLTPDFNAKMIEIFSMRREQQIIALETYLLSQLQTRSFDLIHQIIKDLENDLQINAIAEKYRFTRQYINKLFLKHIGKSPAEYRKIHRFRKSLLQQKISKNYTELSQHGFYDQSHFIKDFKKFTHNKPQSFFNQVDTDKENIWFFIP